MKGRSLLVGAGATAAAVATGAAAVRSAGARIAATTDADLDPLLEAPDGVTHHRLASFDGGVVHAVEKGHGPPIVLLHGVTLQWDVWAGLFHELCGDHRVIAWDMRGHGESTPGDEGVTLEAIGTDIVTMLAELDVGNALVVGHSMGGMALARFCRDHPATVARRVGHGVFLSTSASPLHPITAGTALHRAAIAGLTASMSGRSRYRWADNDLSRVLLRIAFGRQATGRAVGDMLRYMAEMDERWMLDAWLAIAHHDVTNDLADVRLPSTVVTGTLDRLTPPRHARALCDALPDAELVLIEGIGHQVMQEDPVGLSDALRVLVAG